MLYSCTHMATVGDKGLRPIRMTVCTVRAHSCYM